MAVPKQKSSKARSRRRRSTYEKSLRFSHVSICPNCESHKISHCVCGYCGFYKDKQVLDNI